MPVEISHRKLPNGLRVVGIHRPDAAVALLCVDVRVGSRHESPSESGLSHFLEHMVFQGAEGHVDGDAVNRAAESIGSQLDAFTDRDTTHFEHRVHPTHLDQSAALLSTILRTPAFESIETERAIILEEALDEFDEDGTRTDADTLSRLDLWPRSALGQALIGDRANLERFSVTDLRRFHAAHYRAPNMVATVVGPQPAGELCDLLERHFATLPNGTRSEPASPGPLGDPPGLRFVPSGRSQVEARLLFRTPSGLHEDATALSMLRIALDSGLSARMYKRLGGELGLAYDQWALWEAYHDVGAFELGAHCSPAKVATLVDEAYALLDGLVHDPPQGDELEHIRFRARWGLQSALDTAEGLVQIHGSPRLYYPDEPPSPAELLRRIDATGRDTLARVASEVFVPSGHIACFIGPMEKSDRRGLRAAVRAFGSAS